MRIAFAHYSMPDDISGVTTWLTTFASQLRGEGCDVAVHLHHSGEDLHSASILPALQAAGVEISIVPRQRSLLADMRQTLAFLDAWRPTVFLPQCRHAHVLAAAVAGRKGLPWAFTFHSDDPDYWAAAESFPPRLHGGRTVCVSRHISEQVRAAGLEEHPWVIPYGVPIPPQQVSFDAAPFRVAYSGRLWDHQKRIALVTDALIRACRDPRLAATVIGEGHARSASELAVREAGLAETIRFTGSLPPAGVQSELARCQAILLMSDFEGLPIALLEAMALGVVPVVRAIPSGIPELVEHEHTGLLVSGDPQEAAQALQRLASDPALWERCSRNARARVSDHYSREASYATWCRLLDELHGQCSVSYPLGPAPPIDIRRLAPLLTASYRRPNPLLTRLRHRLDIGQARLKHAVRSILRAKG